MRRFLDKFYHSSIKKDDVYRFYRLFKESQYWSLEKQKEYQLNLMQKLWNHAITQVPFYEEFSKFHNQKTIHSLEDLQNLPIIDKEIFRSDISKFYAKNISKDRFKKNATSGSTGSNFFFYSDVNQGDISRALMMRRYDWMHVNPFDRELIIWGTNWNNEGSKKSKTKYWKDNRRYLSGYNLSDSDILNIYNLLVKDKVKIIKSYPSILTLMAEKFKEFNLTYKPNAIHIGGEKLYNFQREKIKEIFDRTIYDFYGARDMPNIAQSCDNNNGLHIFMENVIVEVVNEKGSPIEEGEGDIVVTNLHNYVMPFIRYRIGDRAKISKNKECSCGRKLPLLDEIVGRSFELITFPNGNRVMGTFWTLLFKSEKGIQDFKVVQEENGEIIVYFTSTNEFKDGTVNLLIQKIKDYGGKDLKINFIKRDKISKSKVGKMNFVVSKFKN